MGCLHSVHDPSLTKRYPFGSDVYLPPEKAKSCGQRKVGKRVSALYGGFDAGK